MLKGPTSTGAPPLCLTFFSSSTCLPEQTPCVASSQQSLAEDFGLVGLLATRIRAVLFCGSSGQLGGSRRGAVGACGEALNPKTLSGVRLVHKVALFCAGWKDKEKMGAGGFLCVLRKPAFIRYETNQYRALQTKGEEPEVLPPLLSWALVNKPR
jgi:hypothetical protein